MSCLCTIEKNNANVFFLFGAQKSLEKNNIDECETESNICTQQCVNSIGSFFCGCETGFTLTDGYKCIDINECDMKNDCEQLCTNTDGGYKCSCLYESQEDFCKDLSCSYTCDKNKEGKFHCICPKGFHLSSDERSCEDDDECTNRICQHNCNNTKGSFECSCLAGFMLDTDGFSCKVSKDILFDIYCKKCEIRKWGLNCANYCNCVNGECDPVFGCQCDAGFYGSKCDQDVNECKITEICNDPYKTCFNTYGSYDCRCKDGYYEENKICKNINECDEVLLNQCDEKTTTCVDTIGNFTCVCNPGYVHDDIDECLVDHPCEQLCINNQGSYQCQCQNGYVSDYGHCPSLNCSYSCTLSNGTFTCFCPSWSELDSDKKTCKGKLMKKKACT
ncbi:hypothetical protein KUTeg_015411 [Tegillarca granosa]|uniref:EGF-like domain-containing protein n=1 Tax=Tegillarca granosa TaxID=220873 RepID=A0ABQ9EQ13_TEGGR|nr:hypothetical protein KUTeg_015411 [Tegillarca granosa]